MKWKSYTSLCLWTNW